jgi:oxalate decarboxylase/phosphoglucose isomerase-like protein (cupin superfamily)
MPPAEAVWQPAGERTLENRGRARFDAIAIEIKDPAAPVAAATPPEAVPGTDQVDLRRLIDNPRVLVAKLRYRPVTSVDPMHFHPRDTLVVYLKGGYIWQAVEQSRDWYVWPFMRWAPTQQVARGDVDVVPANTFHSFGNAGGDPLEFLAVFIK